MRFSLRKLTVSGLMILLGTLAVVVAGCGPASSGGKLPDSQQIIRLPINAASNDIATMDPAHDQDFYSYIPIQLVFPGLIALDQNGNPTAWAAQSLPTYDQTAKTYTFKVRSGLKWSDGTPIDATTFAKSIDRSMNPCTASAVTYYLYPINDAPAFSSEKCGSDGVTVQGPIKSLITAGDITTPDSQTLVIKLSQNAPYFLDAMAYPTTFAQPFQLIQQYGAKDWTNHLAGFGGNLFTVKAWDHKGHINLVRNDGFWGTKPQLKEIDFTVYKTTNALYADYLDGRLDQGIPPADQYKQAKARKDFHEQPYLGEGYYQPNWAKAPFNNLDARQAFAEAIDKEIIANNILQGSVVPTNHIVPQGMYGYNPNLVGPDGTTSLTGNQTAAKAAMAKYVAEACGGKITSCTPVTLFDTNDPVVQSQDQAVVNMWQNAFPGYPIKTQFVDFNSLLQLIYSANEPQIFGIGWSADYPDPQDWLSLQFAPTSINNTGSVNVPAANTLMAQADQNLDPASRAQQYNQAEQLLVTAVAWIPNFQQKTVYNLPTYVQNYKFSSLGVVTLQSWQQVYLNSH
jgi:peptide/nickel transport system substrate-binding protein/oligopeptide transport system substrate-binding protein